RARQQRLPCGAATTPPPYVGQETTVARAAEDREAVAIGARAVREPATPLGRRAVDVREVGREGARARRGTPGCVAGRELRPRRRTRRQVEREKVILVADGAVVVAREGEQRVAHRIENERSLDASARSSAGRRNLRPLLGRQIERPHVVKKRAGEGVGVTAA